MPLPFAGSRHLTSAASSFVTGQTLAMDRGRLL